MAVDACGFCRKGLKSGAQTYGLDWEKFCTTGIDERELLATGDPRIVQMVEAVKNVKR